MGPGETGQAISLAKYISKKGGRVLFSVNKKINLPFFKQDKSFKLFLLGTPEELKKIIKKEKPEALLLFNSKIWNRHKTFSKHPPFQEKSMVSISVDSNWLFNKEQYPKFPFTTWVDKHLVVFPKKVFNLGLKKNGGGFKISDLLLKKIIPIGFIPFYKKPKSSVISKRRKRYKIEKGEKLIFSYFSGFGASHRIFAFNNLIDSVEKLIKKGKKIKVVCVGPTDNLDEERLNKKWLTTKKSLSSNEYFLTLASSNLVFQHQGMVTLSQAISANVPVICNVHLLKKYSIPRLHFWEVKPFEKIGVCKMYSMSTPVKEISLAIERLLFNKESIRKMRKAQRSISQAGEEKAFNVLKNLIKENL